MAKNKTTETSQSVDDFINQLTDDVKRTDSLRLVQLMRQETGFDARLWGPNIIGFGSYHYKYSSGREGDAPLAAFSPRAKEFSLYLSPDFENKQALLQNFGKHRAAVGCVYIKRLSDVNEDVLKQMINASIKYIKELYS